MRHHPLVAALHKLVAQAQGPMDAKLRKMAGGGHAIPEQDDESSLHKAIADELSVDGRPRSMDAAREHEGDMPPANHDASVVSSPHHEGPPVEMAEGDPPNEPRPSPADMKRKRGVRF